MVGHPLDTIKVRIQSMEVVPGKAPQYTGMIDCAKQIVNKQGFKGLYSGMAGPLAGAVPQLPYTTSFSGAGKRKNPFVQQGSLPL